MIEAFVIAIGFLAMYMIGTMLIDYHYKRKTQFINTLAEKVKEGSNGKTK